MFIGARSGARAVWLILISFTFLLVFPSGESWFLNGLEGVIFGSLYGAGLRSSLSTDRAFTRLTWRLFLVTLCIAVALGAVVVKFHGFWYLFKLELRDIVFVVPAIAAMLCMVFLGQEKTQPPEDIE